MYPDSNEIAVRSPGMPVYGALAPVIEEQRTDKLLLMETERQKLAAWNATQQYYPLDTCVPQLVSR